MLRDTHGDERAPAPRLDRLDELVRLAGEAGLTTTVAVIGDRRGLPGAVDRAAYAVVQEAITNTIRHAGPATVTIALTYHSDALEIEVSDDGSGGTGSAGTVAAGAQGILGMRERCRLLGGDLTAGPRPRGGFRVRARLPVAPCPAAPVAGEQPR
jgi:signal transduction histidine kinase